MSNQAESPAAEPRASRPSFPEGYGVPKGEEDLLPWSYAARGSSRPRTTGLARQAWMGGRTPRVALGWTQFPKDATRWTFGEG
jgi:hypothetical protein